MATDIENLQANMVNLIQKLTDKMEITDQRSTERSIKFQEELQVSVKSLFTAEATFQRTAITEQFQVQADRVTKLEATLATMRGEMLALKGDAGDDEPLILKMLEYETFRM